MAASTFPSHNLVETIVRRTTAYPYQTLFFVLAVVCAATRVVTGLRNYFQSRSSSGLKHIAVLPYWTPFLGSAFQFLLRFQDFLGDARYRDVFCALRVEGLIDISALLPRMEYLLWSWEVGYTTSSQVPVLPSRSFSIAQLPHPDL